MSSNPNESYTISPGQMQSYQRDGYLILNDVLSAQAGEQLQAWSGQVHGWPDVPDRHMAYTETLKDGTIGTCRTENYAN